VSKKRPSCTDKEVSRTEGVNLAFKFLGADRSCYKCIRAAHQVNVVECSADEAAEKVIAMLQQRS